VGEPVAWDVLHGWGVGEVTLAQRKDRMDMHWERRFLEDDGID
jgi:hypothetical protein